MTWACIQSETCDKLTIFITCNLSLCIGWWFVAVNGREGWAPFSYLERGNGTQSDSGMSGDGSEEEEDSISPVDSESPSKYGRQTNVYTYAYHAQQNTL